ncbi:circularly permuted type 2 ATP-grasp protein [Bremerella cremea]|uniref:circularly permuted type 2 ATP-grasp protein n=1 Tax=Bremerella cremea TaxID=1031537 RepID=UPI001F3EBFD5|nr:circularly permuted type 2 ATP-grasp protein [Bremerella cremea]
MTRIPAQNDATSDLFASYKPLGDVYDEFHDGTQVRPHWQSYVNGMREIGAVEFQRRWNQMQKVLDRTGMAYVGAGNSSPEQDRRARPWELDPLPVLFPAAEWGHIVQGLKQRGRLLQMVLQDLYGPQELVRSGVLPAEVLFRHPGYYRCFHGQNPPSGNYLYFYAADLSRSPDGSWWVQGDRSESPSGSGFALENRIIQSRMTPSLFHRENVQRLAGYFMMVKEAVLRSCSRVTNPRVVILSNGSESSNYFEDAYLARYLGYTLVEPGDLAVRGNRVMLKTLGGLLPVDVILRRPNSDQCDPLEIGQCTGGIAELLQVCRMKNVVVLNPLGSGIVESPIFMTFMPQLCQHLLGEPLLLPGVATWRCGDSDALGYVLDNIDNLVIKPAYRRRGTRTPVYRVTSEEQKDKLVRMIQADPAMFVAQEQVARSTSPVYERKTLRPAHIAMRAFGVMGQSEFEIMPGGLVRLTGELQPLEASLQVGERSKDAWVLSSAPIARVTLLKQPEHGVELKRTGGELPSRIAENLFWLGRNLERADVTARVLRTTISRLTSEEQIDEMPEVIILLRTMAEMGMIETGYGVTEIRKQLPPIERNLAANIFDEQNSMSLRSIVTQIFRLTSRSRDRVSSDSWRVLHRVDQGFQPPKAGYWDLSDCLALLDDLVLDLAAFSGIISESITRTQVYHFLDMGRRMERATQSSRLMRNCLVLPAGDLSSILEALLEISDSLITYRSRYLEEMHLGAVLDLLVTDETNPRSIARQLAQLLDHVNGLPSVGKHAGYTVEQRLAMSMLHEVRMFDVTRVRAPDALVAGESLHLLLQEIESLLPKLSDIVTQRYLVHSMPQSHLVEIRP